MNSDLRWNFADAPWIELRPERMRDETELFYMVGVASLIEITTDLYTRNLLAHFAGDAEVTGWLSRGWEPEELQHGHALREYVCRAWPDCDWDAIYAGFYADYAPLTTTEQLFPTRSLELAARCVVEMGTSSYYTALHRACGEPVLAWLTRNIYEDEIGHYKHFLRYFQKYRKLEGTSRREVLGALWHRLKLIDDEDSYIAVKHMHAAAHPGRPYDRQVHKRIVGRCRRFAARHVPHRMSAKMLLKPLDMTPLAQRLMEPVVTGIAKVVA